MRGNFHHPFQYIVDSIATRAEWPRIVVKISKPEIIRRSKNAV
jgi:hypothetical protein